MIFPTTGNLDEIKEMIENGVDVNVTYEYTSPFHEAAIKGDCLQFLHEKQKHFSLFFLFQYNFRSF